MYINICINTNTYFTYTHIFRRYNLGLITCSRNKKTEAQEDKDLTQLPEHIFNPRHLNPELSITMLMFYLP